MRNQMLMTVIVGSIIYCLHCGSIHGQYCDKDMVINITLAIALLATAYIIMGGTEGFISVPARYNLSSIEEDAINTGLYYDNYCPDKPVFGQNQFEEIQFQQEDIENIVRNQKYNTYKKDLPELVIEETDLSRAIAESAERHKMKQTHGCRKSPHPYENGKGKNRGYLNWS